MMIYRYRGINDISLNALLNNELFVSIPKLFNDPFDSCFSYDVDNVLTILLDRPIFLKNIFIYSFYQEHHQKPTNSEIDNAIEEFKSNKERMKKIIDGQCFNALTLLRDQFYVGCFSKEIKNTVLWAHYADCGKGFAIEYDYDELSKVVSDYYKSNRYTRQTYRIYDVNYNETQNNNDALMIDILESFADFLLMSLDDPKIKRFRYEPKENLIKEIFLYKDMLWNYEKESRIILPRTNLSKPFVSLGQIKPKAIYLGVNIEEHNKYLILKMCEEKHIKLFQMKLVFGENKQRLDYIPILK